MHEAQRKRCARLPIRRNELRQLECERDERRDGIVAIEARVGERSWFANQTNTLNEATLKGIAGGP